MFANVPSIGEGFLTDLNNDKMNIENYFEQEKGITVDAARNAGARYTAIDICRFAKKYHESEVKNLSSNTMLADRLPELFRNFIRTNHLTSKWEDYLKENKGNFR